MTTAERYARAIDFFRETMPKAKTELSYGDDFQLLVAVMLSAQCTDKRVNMVTPALFGRYPDAESMSKASEADILEYVKSVSYPNSKSQHLVEMSRMLQDEFGGEIPHTLEGLMRLPGVGRKTANVMLNVAFGQPAMPVDTHVFRVAARLGLTPQCKTPEQTERELVAHIQQEHLAAAHHWLILFGRYTCTALRPKCAECGLKDLCIKDDIAIGKVKPRSRAKVGKR